MNIHQMCKSKPVFHCCLATEEMVSLPMTTLLSKASNSLRSFTGMTSLDIQNNSLVCSINLYLLDKIPCHTMLDACLKTRSKAREKALQHPT